MFSEDTRNCQTYVQYTTVQYILGWCIFDSITLVNGSINLLPRVNEQDYIYPWPYRQPVKLIYKILFIISSNKYNYCHSATLTSTLPKYTVPLICKNNSLPDIIIVLYFRSLHFPTKCRYLPSRPFRTVNLYLFI